MMHAYYLCQWILFFFIYSFAGWVWECCYVSVRKRRWVNRGFMHGPILPLYGSGALVILIGTIPVRENTALVFICGMIGATILEYITGAAMERIFHVKYWDYSGQPGNIRGYICPAASLCWGLFSVLMVRFVHVPVESAVLKIPLTVCESIATVLAVAASVDFTQSFNEAMDMKNILVQLEESRDKIRQIQEKLKVTQGEVLADYRKYYPLLVTDEDREDNVIPSLVPQWDHTPRSGWNGSFFVNATPEYFYKHAVEALDAVREKKNKMLFLKSWNEWGEGNFMEPDLTYGRGFIEALRKAVDKYNEE